MNTRVVVIDTPRDVLSAILRRAAPAIIALIAGEAARSNRAGPDDVAAYTAWMNAASALALDAVAAEDTQRLRILASFAEIDVDSVRPVPPVARVGLLEIGLRLADAEVRQAVASRPDGADVHSEFRRFADELRAALKAAGAVPNGGR